MKVAGSVIALIAGIFGCIAAVATLLLGGIGSAFSAQGANTVIGLGWGGVIFSFLVIVWAACALGVRGRWPGVLLMISALAGACLGGTLVAVCMALALVGGLLSMIAKREAPMAASSSLIGHGDQQASSAGQRPHFPKWAMVLGGVVILLVLLVALAPSTPKSALSSNAQPSPEPQDDPITQLVKAQPSALAPTGELAAMFTLGSDNTDLQRDNELAKIKGQVVQWRLRVYEVSKDGDGYRIQTDSGNDSTDATMDAVGTFADITPRNDADRQKIANLKTGDFIVIKGVIADVMMRNLVLDPAILVDDSE